MSREERRQYERMMRGMDRGPALPPAARAKAERQAARRAARRGGRQRSHAFDARFFIVSVAVSALFGFLAFSLQWPQMPFALYVGLAVAGGALAAQIGVRLLQRRADANRP